MDIQKITWKIYFKNPEACKPEEFFKVFSTWIPNSPEIFVDVIDYKHVVDGPLTLLAGHYVDYMLDHTDRRLGFLYSAKKPLNGSNSEKIEESLADFLESCKRLIEDPLFKGKLQFKTNELLFMINDRGIAPNTPETFSQVKPDLEKVTRTVFGSDSSLEQVSDPKKRFSVILTCQKETDLKKLIDRLS